MSSMHDSDNRIILCDFPASEFLHHFVRGFSAKWFLNELTSVMNKNTSSIFDSFWDLWILAQLDYQIFRSAVAWTYFDLEFLES